MLIDADSLVAAVRTWDDEIVARGLDRKNWGPVKTYLMGARETGPEAMSERRLMEFFRQQLNEVAEAVAGRPEAARQTRTEPPIPIVELRMSPPATPPAPAAAARSTRNATAAPGRNRPQVIDPNFGLAISGCRLSRTTRRGPQSEREASGSVSAVDTTRGTSVGHSQVARAESDQKSQSVLRRRSQATTPAPILPSTRAPGAGITGLVPPEV
jgi:hypothetical protein